MNFGEYISIGETLFISAVAISVVFAVLALIAVIISLIGKIVGEKKPEVATTNNKVTQNAVAQVQPKVDLSSVVKDEHKLVATLVATMEANTMDKDVKYKITSIREI